MMSLSSMFILVGEKSGEEHLLSFLPELKSSLPETHFWGVGGDEMQQQGVEIKWHFKQLSTMGFSGVIGKLSFYCLIKSRSLSNGVSFFSSISKSDSSIDSSGSFSRLRFCFKSFWSSLPFIKSLLMNST